MGDYDLIVEDRTGRKFLWPDYSKLRLSKKQAEYQYHEGPLEIGLCGRGYGKDFGALFKKARRGNRGYWRNRTNPAYRRSGLRWHTGIFAGETDSYEDNINKLFSILPRVPGKGVGGKPNFHWNSTDQRFEMYGERQWWISMYSLYGKGQKRGPGFDDVLVTEAQEISKDKIMSVIMPMIVRGGYKVNCTLIGTGNCGWFDDAYEEAQAGDSDTYWGNWFAYDGTSFDNPMMDRETAAQAMREYFENPSRFMIERLGLPNIILQPDERPDLRFTEALVACCLTHERMTMNGAPLLVIDTMYGGDDLLCMGVWNQDENALLWLEYYTTDPKRAARDNIELIQIDKANPNASLSKFFMMQHQRFPGCRIAFDCQGQYGGTLALHIPKHISIIPMRRNRAEKNAMVESTIDRMGFVDSAGRSMGIKLPHPDSKWLNARQRQQLRKFYTDLYNYRRVTEVNSRGETVYYFTKGVGFEDDGPDMLTWSVSQLRPMNKVVPNIAKSGRAAKRALYL